MYKVTASRQAKKDAVNVERNGLKPEVEKIIETVERDPYYPSQEFEELKGNWKGVYPVARDFVKRSHGDSSIIERSE